MKIVINVLSYFWVAYFVILCENASVRYLYTVERVVMQNKNLTLPNCISFLRILGACGLFFTEEFSNAFFALYTLCGISDVLDGWIARRTKTITELGSRLDSVGDLLLYSIMIIKILPELFEVLPLWIWCVIWAAVALRIVTYVMVAIRFKRFASLHTYMNKVTGFAAFGIPYFMKAMLGVPYCSVGCIIAGTATLEEFLIHAFAKEYPEGKKTLFFAGSK